MVSSSNRKDNNNITAPTSGSHNTNPSPPARKNNKRRPRPQSSSSSAQLQQSTNTHSNKTMVDQHATSAQGNAQPVPPSSIETTTTTTYLASANGSAVRRIRTPHPHDVLSGRGGGINGHPGNVRFREWVRVRKNDYNLAINKAEKAEVAREVIQQVLDQSPPGRFLQKDPSSVGAVGWWIELDDERVLAKTAQALREGAPLIRAEHRDDRHHPQSHSHSHRASSPSSTHKRHANAPTSQLPPPVVDAAVDQLRANARAAAAASAPATVNNRPPVAKRVRVDYNGHVLHPTDETPPLLSTPHPPLPDTLGLLEEELGGSGPRLLPPPASFPARPVVGHGNGNGSGLKRVHSLALSDVSWGEWATEDFVNPFEGDELRRLEAIRTGHATTNTTNNGLHHNHHQHHGNSHHNRVRPGVMVTRESSSNSSHGDLGGLAALMGSGPLDHQRRTSSSSISSNTNMHGRPEEFGERGVATGVRDDNNSSISSISPSIWNSRALTPLPSDFADSNSISSLSTLPTVPPTDGESDFTEGMKSIYNALHSDDYLDGEDDGSGGPGVPTLWYPYNKSRGGLLSTPPSLRRAASWASRGNDGRQ